MTSLGDGKILFHYDNASAHKFVTAVANTVSECHGDISLKSTIVRKESKPRLHEETVYIQLGNLGIVKPMLKVLKRN